MTESTSALQKTRGFQPGKSGNPNGRPRGSRNKTTLAVEALLEGEAEGLTRKAIELAQAGDMAALRLCLDRIAPARKDRVVNFELPVLEKASDAVAASAAIVAAVASGELTPTEASELSKVIDAFTRAIEAHEFDERLSRLENQKKEE
jgi:hypothetical protein